MGLSGTGDTEGDCISVLGETVVWGNNCNRVSPGLGDTEGDCISILGETVVWGNNCNRVSPGLGDTEGDCISISGYRETIALDMVLYFTPGDPATK
jgi:hypothetical protein